MPIRNFDGGVAPAGGGCSFHAQNLRTHPFGLGKSPASNKFVETQSDYPDFFPWVKTIVNYTLSLKSGLLRDERIKYERLQYKNYNLINESSMNNNKETASNNSLNTREIINDLVEKSSSLEEKYKAIIQNGVAQEILEKYMGITNTSFITSEMMDNAIERAEREIGSNGR